jgi:DNA-binding MarR family transcriptional regulator
VGRKSTQEPSPRKTRRASHHGASSAEGEEQRTQTRRKNINFGPLADRIGFVMRRAQLLIAREFNVMLQTLDLNTGQFMILTLVAHNPGLKQTEVSAALWIKRSNMVSQLRELERRGLVRRLPACNDRRSYALHLSPSGIELLQNMTRVSREHDRRMTNILGDHRKQQLMRLLRQITETAKSVDS